MLCWLACWRKIQARTILEIPVPEVYAWSANVENPVGAEYIIMEEAVGKQAADSWETMELEHKVTIVKELISIEKKLLSISFLGQSAKPPTKQNIADHVVALVTYTTKMMLLKVL